MDCSNCTKTVYTTTVPLVVLENTRAQMDLHAKRLIRVIVLLVVLLVGSNVAWLWYESQFTVETTHAEIEQDTDGGGNNYVVGGDFNGEAESQDNNEEADP